MTTTEQQKAPSADLAGCRAEGLNNPSSKELNKPMIPQPVTPAQWCRQQRALERLDLPMLAHGTIDDLVNAANDVGVTPAQLLDMLDIEGDK